ncbi:MAG TPA: hypothetical protein VGH33_21385 [Isosphaeraceae bacterium]
MPLPARLLALALLAASPAVAADLPLALHPDNPHYFLFRGKPAVLVTSGEHYGAVLNLDFDFVPYLDELKARGFDLTRLFSGTYREVPGSFKIEANTLAPKPGRFCGPYARSESPGADDGGAKFDLDRTNPDYFPRLKSFLAEASKRGIVVEFSLFCPFYEDNLWAVNAWNPRNSVNGTPNVQRTEVYTLKHAALVERQRAFVRRVVTELNGFDNLYFEICNEPYFGGVTLDWQAAIGKEIDATEDALPNRHLIAQNIANNSAKIENPNPLVSIFNFHYARPPVTVALNYALGKPIGDDETGFDGTADLAYRSEAWLFLLAGGSVFSNLDYSFTPDHEDGSAKVNPPTPGGGGPAFRSQLAYLKRFVEGFDFLKMEPSDDVLLGGVPINGAARALGAKGRAYAIYVKGGPQEAMTLDLALPPGEYRVEWHDPVAGKVIATGHALASGMRTAVKAPPFREDIALKLVFER